MKEETIKQYSELENRPRPFIDRLARRLMLRLLTHIDNGSITIIENHSHYTFGEETGTSDLQGTIIIHNTAAYRHILFRNDIGAGESYMLGLWSSPDLVKLVRVMSLNLAMLNRHNTILTALHGCVDRVLHFFRNNSVTGSKKNIRAHYDLSNDFFRVFLDPGMMYSCAVYPETGIDLETASFYKLDQLCKKLKLCADDHLLEIGTGWGGMAIHAASHYGCRVTTTTISKEQYDYACQKVNDAGLEDKITILLKDYRELEGCYDKLVSVEMIEAVGHQFYRSFFETCSKLLKNDGLMVLQAITIPDQRYHASIKSVDFIQKYIFPGGELPSNEIIAVHSRKDTDMQIIHLEDISPHYARTLADWKHNFFTNLDMVKSLGFDDVFIRMWDFYLSYCEGGFHERVISTSQFVLAKPGYRFSVKL